MWDKISFFYQRKVMAFKVQREHKPCFKQILYIFSSKYIFFLPCWARKAMFVFNILKNSAFSSEIMDTKNWHFPTHFPPIIYIFLKLQEDDIDQLHLGYTSFSENKISKVLVFQYFMYIILKLREPTFQDVSSNLLPISIIL